MKSFHFISLKCKIENMFYELKTNNVRSTISKIEQRVSLFFQNKQKKYFVFINQFHIFSNVSFDNFLSI